MRLFPEFVLITICMPVIINDHKSKNCSRITDRLSYIIAEERCNKDKRLFKKPITLCELVNFSLGHQPFARSTIP